MRTSCLSKQTLHIGPNSKQQISQPLLSKLYEFAIQQPKLSSSFPCSLDHSVHAFLPEPLIVVISAQIVMIIKTTYKVTKNTWFQLTETIIDIRSTSWQIDTYIQKLKSLLLAWCFSEWKLLLRLLLLAARRLFFPWTILVRKLLADNLL